MKRALLSILGVLALSVAGSALAQSDYGTTGQTGEGASPATTTGSAPQQGTTDVQTAPSSATGSMQGAGSATAPAKGSTAPSAATAGAPGHESLPRTASDVPLVLVIGLSAAGAMGAVHLYRLRRAH